MGKERRVAPRADISLEVEIRTPGSSKVIEATVVNISKTGAFIETKEKAHIGDEVELVIHLDEKLLFVKPHATVVYASDEKEVDEEQIKSVEEMRKWLLGQMRNGWGVKFSNLTEKDEELLNAFVVAIR